MHGQHEPAPHTILVVEDSEPLRRMMRLALEVEGYATVEAADGTEAIAVLDRAEQEGGLSLVLLDLELPRIDGLTILRHLRDRGSRVPVVAMSANYAPLSQAGPLGARDLLTKPFDPEHLLAVVARNCSRAAA